MGSTVMLDTDFRKLLEKLDEELKELLGDRRAKVTFPDANDELYDLGQSEIIQRVSMVAETLEHASTGCEACQEGLDSDIHYARQVITKYLQGQLTRPELYYNATYTKEDGTSSHSILYQDGEEGIIIRSAQTDFARQLQAVINSSENKHSLPDVDGYKRRAGNDQDEPRELVLFSQERS